MTISNAYSWLRSPSICHSLRALLEGTHVSQFFAILTPARCLAERIYSDGRDDGRQCNERRRHRRAL